MPPLVAYLLPLVIPLSGPGLSWLRFATIVWALLGILIALDPAWTDRIAKMRQGLDLLRNAAPPKGAEGAQHHMVRLTPPRRRLQTSSGRRLPAARHAHAIPSLVPTLNEWRRPLRRQPRAGQAGQGRGLLAELMPCRTSAADPQCPLRCGLACGGGPSQGRARR